MRVDRRKPPRVLRGGLVCLPGALVTVFGALLSGASPALAKDTSAPQARIGAAIDSFTYREEEAGVRLNEEDGALGGMSLSVQRRWNAWSVAAHADLVGGVVDYRGLTNLGTPFDSRTDTLILDTHARAAWCNEADCHWFAALGYRYWQRDIRGDGAVAGLDEDYRWPYLGVGGGLDWGRGESGTWYTEVFVKRMFGGRIDADFGNQFDSASLEMDAAWGLQLLLRWQSRTNSDYRPYAEVLYRYWDAEASDKETLFSQGAPIGTIFEPASETWELGLRVGVSYSL